jgi:cytoskeletal protein CcmA (bactofilin family)
MSIRSALLTSDPAREPAPATTPSDPNPVSQERRQVAWVGKSVVFVGHLSSSEDMMIDGRVEGTIEVRDHTLTIGPDAHIHANVTANIVRVLGGVTGTVTAITKVDITETGSVEGDVICPRLALADGGTLRGRVR